MLGPTIVKLTHFFYPIGNTPAVNLLETGSNQNTQDDAPTNVLMLGCGDPRNILFSLWCNENLNTDMELLRSHTEKLLQASESLVTWSSSPYGKTVHLLSVHTLEQIRHVWTHYHEIATLGAAERRCWEAKYTRGVQSVVRKHLSPDKETSVLHGVRSTGPHWIRALRISSFCFRKYWETGVVAGNLDDQRDLRHCAGGRANPMMAISSAPDGEFAVHYGTDPLLGFHLASVLDNEFSDETYAVRIAELAKSKFREWCQVFGDQHRAEAIKVRIFCGDALRFCYELQHFYHSSSNEWHPDIVRLYTAPWYSKPFDLQMAHCPKQLSETTGFQVIDTSNLVDHLGLLNILPATAPLLAKNRTSVLFTNCLLKAAEKTSDTLSTLLCSDVTTISFLLGLAPTSHLLGYSTEAYGMEAASRLIIPGQSGRQTQSHMRIAWRSPTFGDIDGEGSGPEMNPRVLFQEDQLLSYFFKLYQTMFSYENLSLLMGGMMRQLTSPLSTDFRHYNRMSFVALLGLAKSRYVTADWHAFISSLVDRIECDRELLIGSNQIQELHVLLHLSGLFSNSMLSAPHPRKLPRIEEIYGPMRSPSAGSDHGLLDQQNIPSVVWLCLKVPRKKLDVFTSQHEQSQGLGTPGVHVNVSQLELGFQNSFFSTQCFFGKLTQRAEDNYTCDVVEDKVGWRGTSDLIITCAVLVWPLLLGSADSIRIDLTLSSSPTTAALYSSRLGLTLSVYGCGLQDQNVVVLREPPGIRLSNPYLGPLPPPAINDICFVQLDRSSRIETMEIRKKSEKSSLKNAKVVQVSACALSVRVPNNENSNLLFRYPYPIDTRQAKIVSTRNTVSVIVKPSTARNLGGYDHNPFPVDINNSYPTSLTFPRINLNQQPLISTTQKLAWTETFMGFALSSQERILYNSTPGNQIHKLPALLQLKSSLNVIIQSISGMHPSHERLQIFHLATTSGRITEGDGNVDTIIFGNALRHNPAQQSIVLDAYIVPLDESRVEKILPAFTGMMRSGKVLNIKVTPAEEFLWKQMIPAMAEACRTWQHTPSCQYKANNSSVPLSTIHGEIPICSCGEGKDTDDFPSFQGAEALKKFATRIAIMPLCAVPFVEEIIGAAEMEGLASQESEVNRGLRTVRTKCNTCGKSEGSLKKCSRCGVVWYCNHGCQKADWKAHKRECKKSAGQM
ncbi:hypothetical protein ACMFMG_006752 [Clarireedia jacksonii]